jgi:peptidyl-prolyl cis-trans isomerase D
MLRLFRESFGRYVTIAILGLIAITFVFFGIDFSITSTSFAAKVNGESISITEFERELQTAQRQYQQLYAEEFTDDIRRALRQSVVDRLVMREVMLQRARDTGFRVSDERLIDSVRDVTAFQVAGEFSPDVYRSLLAGQGLTPTLFESMQRADLTLLELQNGLDESSFATPVELRRTIELLYERRETAYALFAAADFLDGVEVSDDAVAEYYAENGREFMTEEAVDLEAVELELASIAATIDVGEEELREAYEEQSALFASSEERRVSHILIEVEGEDDVAAEAEAARTLERLEAGEDFVTLAAEVSDDAGTRNTGGDLGWIARGVLSGPFEDALFAMELGAIEGPVETEFGYHILRLEEARAGEQRPFEDVQDELRDEIASQSAFELFYDTARELDQRAFEERDDLATVAMELDLPLVTIEALTRANAEDHFANPAPIVAVAFDEDAIETGESSDLIELSDERVAVIRVARHYPPEPETLEAVSEEIRARLALLQAQELAAGAAAAFLEALGDDEIERAAELAEAHGGSWNERRWIDRRSADVPPNVVSLVFAQPKPAAGGRPAVQRTPLTSGDEAVALLFAVEPGDPANLPVEERERGQQDLADFATEIELGAYAAEARRRAKVRVPEQVLDPGR